VQCLPREICCIKGDGLELGRVNIIIVILVILKRKLFFYLIGFIRDFYHVYSNHIMSVSIKDHDFIDRGLFFSLLTVMIEVLWNLRL